MVFALLALTSYTGMCVVNRHLKIVVYGKRLTSDTLLVMKTKSLTVKYITYRIYSKYRKVRIETPCLTTKTWRLILNVLCSDNLTFDLYRLTFAFYN